MRRAAIKLQGADVDYLDSWISSNEELGDIFEIASTIMVFGRHFEEFWNLVELCTFVYDSYDSNPPSAGRMPSTISTALRTVIRFGSRQGRTKSLKCQALPALLRRPIPQQ